jgi:hypothetical protein
MDPSPDPTLITLKVTVPGHEGESAIRKFKVTIAQIQKEVIHKTVQTLFSFTLSETDIPLCR